MNECMQKRETIAKSCFLLNHTSSHRNLNDIFRGNKGFKPQPFRMRGKIDWDDNIEKNSCFSEGEMHPNHQLPDQQVEYDILQVDLLKCPNAMKLSLPTTSTFKVKIWMPRLNAHTVTKIPSMDYGNASAEGNGQNVDCITEDALNKEIV